MMKLRSRLLTDRRKETLANVVAVPCWPPKWRDTLMRCLGASLSDQAVIVRGARIGPATSVGPGCFVNHSAYIDSFVTLERDVAVGPGAWILSVTHQAGDGHRRWGLPETRPVRIGAGTWIGARAVILPGITIGPGCVIGAGAVVTKDCEPNGMYGGVPAKRQRDLPTDSAKPPGVSATEPVPARV